MRISTQCEEHVCQPDVKLEHYASARACRMMLKGRTHQLVSYDVSAVSFRAWLERDARVKPPKGVRLSDDWLRYVMKAFRLLSSDARAPS